jgi:hypothetical protein
MTQYKYRINYCHFSTFSVELKALSGVGNRSESGSNERLVIHNHLRMNDREIASIVSNVTANIGSRRQRHSGREIEIGYISM